MPFDFGGGNCIGDIGHNDEVIMCSNSFDETGCWSWDGFTHDGFHRIDSTQVSHYAGGLDKINGTAVAWSGDRDAGGTTEMLVDGSWRLVSYLNLCDDPS